MRKYYIFKAILIILFCINIQTVYGYFVPIEWKSKSVDYYILEFSDDSSFGDIIKIYQPTENKLVIEVNSGTYYLKVTPISNNGENHQESMVRTIEVDDNGKVSYSSGSSSINETYPDSSEDIGKYKAVMINFPGDDTSLQLPPEQYSSFGGSSTGIKGGGLRYRACWDKEKQVWVPCD